jgi:hypothetical protein
MYSQEETERILSQNFHLLNSHCQFLAQKYNETLGGDYRIQYNNLYNLLYSPISLKKKTELLNSLSFPL